MNLQAYEQLVSSEASARKYVLGFCFKFQQRICPRCRFRKLYRLSDGRRRCSRCEYTSQELAGRWLSQLRISCAQWLRVVKLFELEVSTRKMAYQLGISYKTAANRCSELKTKLGASGKADLVHMAIRHGLGACGSGGATTGYGGPPPEPSPTQPRPVSKRRFGVKG